jgi:flagellar basal body P-ring protein FlgI
MARLALYLLLGLFLCSGCATELFRLQSDDESKLKDPKDVKETDAKEKPADVKTIGDITGVWGAHPVRVYGVGVVYGLQGTGSDPQPDEYRRMALHDLKQTGIEEPGKFLASPNTAIVLVSAVLPPGIHKGEPIDVEVELPPRDKATSLRGGKLMACDLREYADSHELRGQSGAHASVRGKVLATASGPIMVGLGETSDKERLRRGKVWGGGRAGIDRNFMLLLNKDSQDARLAKQVAERVNERFFGQFRGSQRGMAEAKTNTEITLKVPSHYRLNWPRYLRVVRNIPLRDNAPGRSQYRKQVLRDLQNPAHCVPAALKLEALGTESEADLKAVLNHEHPLVRFSAAEALAYLGDPASAQTLSQVLAEQPRLQAYGLTALASLDEGISHVVLRELLNSPSARTRYGAFRALWALDEKEAALNEELLNERFSLHCVAQNSSPMVHISTIKRAEIVVFGDKPVLKAPFSLQAGPEYAVTAREGEQQCVVSRFSANAGVQREFCSMHVDEIIRKLAGMGAGYSEVVEFLEQGNKTRSLSCRVEIDALPESVSVMELAVSGAVDAGLVELKRDADEKDDTVDFGLLPNLFARPSKTKASK